MLLLPMFLRSTPRKKNNRIHRYFSVVENRRLPDSRTVQRTVLYLGEINDQQQAVWRKTLQIFDEDEQNYRSMSLFPDDRGVPADAVDGIQVKLSGLELRRPRTFGACWLGCELWHQLGLDEFWQERLPEAREAVSWEKVLQLQVVNCLLDPAAITACTGSGMSIRRWTSCCKRTLPWPPRTGCIAVWTGCCGINRSCLSG
jgi:hypothetical protein